MSDNNEILFEEIPGQGGDLGIIILNRQSALNSLNQTIVQGMYEKLEEWESNKNIKAVIVRAAEGRAFCAGGDLRLTYDRMKSQDNRMTEFFRMEYQLNRKIFHYPKPYIAFLDGITMGGGVGISIHGSHRIATDRLLFAMPETGIGFFPDVGGSYFLPRLPGRIGIYLGLTGARITSDACLQAGIATQKISEDAFPELIHELAKQTFTDNARESVSTIIAPFCLPVSPTPLMDHQEDIDLCFSAETVEEILHELSQRNNHFCEEAVKMISKKSPTSLKVSLIAMQKGSNMGFDECMEMELSITSQFLRGHDFAEGIRAVIIDKDQKPVWNPASLNAVNQKDLNHYFS